MKTKYAKKTESAIIDKVAQAKDLTIEHFDFICSSIAFTFLGYYLAKLDSFA
jgi:hypothetical protein